MPLPAAEGFATLLPLAVRGAAWLVNWLATYAVHSTVLIGLTWLACRSPLGSRLPAGQQAALWRFALLAGVVTATLQAAGALAPVTGTVRIAAGMSSRVAFGMFVTALDPLAGPQTVTTRIEIRPLWPFMIALVWLLGVAAGCILLALARRRFFRRLDPRRNGGGLAVAGNALRELQRRAGSRRHLMLRSTRHLHSPVAAGAEEIYLPERALAEFDLQHLESMLAHELAHLERGDTGWLTVARAIEAVFFFQPLNRLARRRMVEAAELAADAWAIGITGRPVTLARCLARVAEWTSAERLSPAPAMVERRSSALVRRVRVLTGGTRPLPALPAVWVRAVMAALIAAATLFIPRTAIGNAGPSLSARRMEVRFHQSGLPMDRETFLIRVARP